MKRWKWVIIGFFVLTGLYAVSRLTNLTALPIFTDEAIYIRWSQIGMRDPAWRFISLTDGKQPMFTWVMMVLLRLFENRDPLFVGRLVSVLSGVAGLIGVSVLSFELFKSRRVMLFAGLMYVISPYTLWYDRMALYDSMVAAFSVWSLYFAVRMVRTLRLDMALILGLVLAGGMLNKTSGFLSLYLLPVTLILFDWRAPRVMRRLFTWVLLAGVAAVLSQVLYSVLRLSPFFHMVSQKDNVFVFSLGEWMNQPFRFLEGNLKGMFDWLREYLTAPVFVAAMLPLFMRWEKMRERVLLYFWWILPFVALATFAKILYPRFILFMSIPLMLVAADALVRIMKRIHRPLVKAAVLTVLLLPSFVMSYRIVLHPQAAPIPLSDRGQYIDDWPAGGGVTEVVAYIREVAKNEDVLVVTEGTFGLMPYALEIYLVDNPNVVIRAVWPLPDAMPEEIRAASQDRVSFLVLNESQEPPAGWPLTLVGEYQKGSRADRHLRFYRIGKPIAQRGFR